MREARLPTPVFWHRTRISIDTSTDILPIVHPDQELHGLVLMGSPNVRQTLITAHCLFDDK